MEQEIPFNEWSREKIKQGVKKCTSRHKKYLHDKRVTSIVKHRWGYIKEFLWKEEGAESPEELQKVIEDIYKRKVPDDELFYVHFGEFNDEVK